MGSEGKTLHVQRLLGQGVEGGQRWGHGHCHWHQGCCMRTWRRLRPHCTPTPLPLHGSRWVGSRGGIGSDAQGSGWQGGDPSPPPLRAPRGCSRPGPPAAEGCPMDPPPSCVPSRLLSIDLAVLILEFLLIAMLCCKTVQPMSKPLAGMGHRAAYHLRTRCVCCMRLVS